MRSVWAGGRTGTGRIDPAGPGPTAPHCGREWTRGGAGPGQAEKMADSAFGKQPHPQRRFDPHFTLYEVLDEISTSKTESYERERRLRAEAEMAAEDHPAVDFGLEALTPTHDGEQCLAPSTWQSAKAKGGKKRPRAGKDEDPAAKAEREKARVKRRQHASFRDKCDRTARKCHDVSEAIPHGPDADPFDDGLHRSLAELEAELVALHGEFCAALKAELEYSTPLPADLVPKAGPKLLKAEERLAAAQSRAKRSSPKAKAKGKAKP